MPETQHTVSRAENFTIFFNNSSLISSLKNELLHSSSLIYIKKKFIITFDFVFWGGPNDTLAPPKTGLGGAIAPWPPPRYATGAVSLGSWTSP